VTCDVVTTGEASGVSAGGGQGPGGTMEVPTLTIACHEGRPPADDIFAYSGCPQPASPRSPCPGPGPEEEARAAARAGRTARRRDRGGDRGVEVVRCGRAVDRRCRGRRAGRAGRGPRPGGGVHNPARLRPGQPGQAGSGPRRLTWTRAVQVSGRLVIAAGGKAVRRDEGQRREGPAPGRGAGVRHRRGPRPDRRGGEVGRDPRGPGPAEGVRQPGRGGHHDRRTARRPC